MIFRDFIFLGALFLGVAEVVDVIFGRASPGPPLRIRMDSSPGDVSDGVSDGWLDDCSSDEESPLVQGDTSVSETGNGANVTENDVHKFGDADSAQRRVEVTDVTVAVNPAIAVKDTNDINRAAIDVQTHVMGKQSPNESSKPTSDAMSYVDFSVKSPFEKTTNAIEMELRRWLRLSSGELAKQSHMNRNKQHGNVSTLGLRYLRVVITDDCLPIQNPIVVSLYYPERSPPNILAKDYEGEKKMPRLNAHTISHLAHGFEGDTTSGMSSGSNISSGLQRWFGVGHEFGGAPFLVVEPYSEEFHFFGTQNSKGNASALNTHRKTFLDVDDASVVKASVAVACTAAGVPSHWPVFAPVLGPARGAFVGRTGDDFCTDQHTAGWCVRYETDSVSGAAADKAQGQTLLGLAQVLQAQLNSLGGKQAADLVNKATCDVRLTFAADNRWRRVSEFRDDDSDDDNVSGDTNARRPGSAFLALAEGVRHFTTEGTKTKSGNVSERDKDDNAASLDAEQSDLSKKEKASKNELFSGAWDDPEPWAPWCALREPWARVEVDAVWERVPLTELLGQDVDGDGGIGDTCTDNLNLDLAPEWCVRVVPVGAVDTRGETSDSVSSFSDEHTARSDPENQNSDRAISHDAYREQKYAGLAELFFLLSNSVADFSIRDAATVGQLASFEFWDDPMRVSSNNGSNGSSTIPRAPPESVVQDVLRDVFEGDGVRGELRTEKTRTDTLSFPTPPRSAPPESFLARIALHCLVFGNPRAVAVLWRRILREIRFAHWDRGQALPRTGGTGFEVRAKQKHKHKHKSKDGDCLRVPNDDDENDDESTHDSFSDDFVDHESCLLHQKLTLIQICIRRRRQNSVSEFKASNAAREIEKERTDKQSQINSASDGWADVGGGWDDDETADETVAQPDDDIDLVALLQGASVEMDSKSEKTDTEKDKNETTGTDTALTSNSITRHPSGDGFETASDGGDDEGLGVDVMGDDVCEPQGVEQVHPNGLTLLNPPHSFMNIPITQPPPVFTADTHKEREVAMHALGDTAEGRLIRVRKQSDQLVSDMSAFKAANPGCCLADFIRWHSPRDWIEEGGKRDDESCETSEIKSNQLPAKGVLSKRMRSETNVWRTLWRDAPSLPAHRQKLLFDPTLEGEKALEYLDHLPPLEIFTQLLSSAASAIGGLYSNASGGQFSASKEALQRAHQMTKNVFGRVVPYPDELASVAGELQRAERAVVRGSALAARMPNVSKDVLDDLLTKAAQDEEFGDLYVQEQETAGVTSGITPFVAPHYDFPVLPVTRPPPVSVETSLSRSHAERQPDSALRKLLPGDDIFGVNNSSNDVASKAEFVVHAGGGHIQTHRAHAVVAPCFLRVSSAVAYQY